MHEELIEKLTQLVKSHTHIPSFDPTRTEEQMGWEKGRDEVAREIQQLLSNFEHQLLQSYMTPYDCPKCESDNTYLDYEFVYERGVATRRCEDCDAKYEIHYKTYLDKIVLIEPKGESV